MKKILCAAFAAVALLSCKKEQAFDSAASGPLTIEFDDVAGASDFALNTTYTNSSGETVSFSDLKYYVSNFKITNINGTVYNVPADDSYFLIDETAGTEQTADLDVPEGEYAFVDFDLGVDSARAAMDPSERTGVLDTAAHPEMYFGATDGYIFFRAIGTSNAAPGNSFSYLIGGNTIALNNLRHVTLDLRNRGTAKVKADKETNIHVLVDVLKIFGGPNRISVAAHPTIGYEPYSLNMSQNFTTLFTHDHTEN